MYFYLKNLTATQQIGALFLIVFGLLLLSSAVAFALSIREYGDDTAGDLRRKELKNLDGVVAGGAALHDHRERPLGFFHDVNGASYP